MLAIKSQRGNTENILLDDSDWRRERTAKRETRNHYRGFGVVSLEPNARKCNKIRSRESVWECDAIIFFSFFRHLQSREDKRSAPQGRSAEWKRKAAGLGLGGDDSDPKRPKPRPSPLCKPSQQRSLSPSAAIRQSQRNFPRISSPQWKSSSS